MSVQTVSSLRRAIEASDWPTAHADLKELIARDPSNAAFHFTLGSVLRNEYRTAPQAEGRRLSLLLEADDAYEEALRLSPSHAEAAVERASLATELHGARPTSRARLAPHQHLRTTEEVAALHKVAVSVQPASAEAHRRRGEWLVDWDDGRHRPLLDEAIRAFSHALRLAPTDDRAAVQLALQQHKRGAWREAAASYEYALRVRPGHSEAYGLLGSLRLHRSRQPGLAEEALREHIRGLGGPQRASASSVQELVQSLQLQGRLEEAQALATRSEPAAGAAFSWTLQNELTLPIYLWRHRAALEPADDTLADSTRRSPRTSSRRAEPLLRHCTGDGSANGLTNPVGGGHGTAAPLPNATPAPAPAPTLSRPLTSCGGDCISRATVVSLWLDCKRWLGWPRPSLLPRDGDPPIVAPAPGGAARETSAPLHLAARWGGASEVRALLHAAAGSHATACVHCTAGGGRSGGGRDSAAAASTDDAPAATESAAQAMAATLRGPEVTSDAVRLQGMLAPRGPFGYTPLHEASLRADCVVMSALLRAVTHQSRSALAALIGARDAFGRSARNLARAVPTQAAECMLAAIDAAAVDAAGHRPLAIAPSATAAGAAPRLTIEMIEAALAMALPHDDDGDDDDGDDDGGGGDGGGGGGGGGGGESVEDGDDDDYDDDDGGGGGGGDDDDDGGGGGGGDDGGGGGDDDDGLSNSEGGVAASDAACDATTAAARTAHAAAAAAEQPVTGRLVTGRRGWMQLRDAHGAGGAPRCDVEVWRVGDGDGNHGGERGSPPQRRDGGGSGGTRSMTERDARARFVRDAVSLDRPVLLRGLLRRAPILRRWSRPAVERAAGREQFQVMQYDARTRELTDPHTWRRVRLSEWVSELRAPRRTSDPRLPEYIFDQSGTAVRGELARAVRPLFPWRALLHAEAAGVYIGGNGSGNPFHCARARAPPAAESAPTGPAAPAEHKTAHEQCGMGKRPQSTQDVQAPPTGGEPPATLGAMACPTYPHRTPVVRSRRSPRARAKKCRSRADVERARRGAQALAALPAKRLLLLGAPSARVAAPCAARAR